MDASLTLGGQVIFVLSTLGSIVSTLGTALVGSELLIVLDSFAKTEPHDFFNFLIALFNWVP